MKLINNKGFWRAVPENRKSWIQGNLWTLIDFDKYNKKDIKNYYESIHDASINNISVYPNTLCLYTNQNDIKNNKIFTSDIVIDENNDRYLVVPHYLTLDCEPCASFALVNSDKTISLKNKQLLITGNSIFNRKDAYEITKNTNFEILFK